MEEVRREGLYERVFSIVKHDANEGMKGKKEGHGCGVVPRFRLPVW